MADKVEATLKQLASISRSLNEVSDLLSKRIAEVEAALGEHKLGVEAWVELRKESQLSEPDDDGGRHPLTYVEQLGYGKYKGKWGLLVAGWCEETFDGQCDQEYFLRDAPREIRLAAVEKIPDLLEALAEKAARISQQAIKNAKEAERLAAGLSRKTR